ncbi:MAG: ABC transporter substrate-binding protein [Actinobacteria bacterium]|nr:ABC transporter substrate-binding protein [Actinomycetota bacterium]
MRATRWVLITLAVVLAVTAFALIGAGCGASNTTTSSTPSTAPGSTETTAGTETTAPASTETTAPVTGKTITIGVTQIVSHPALDATVEGFKEALTEAGYVEGQNVKYELENAQGEMSNASAIAQKFVGDKVDMILSVATPTSQAVVKATSTIPVVFAAVTDPVAAGLVTDPNAPSANVTGVSDMLPVQPHLDLIKALVPNVKTVGLLYNAGETNSVTLVNKEKEAAQAMGLKVVEATASDSSGVLAAAQSLIGRVDAISVLTDNTVVSALESVVKVCNENKIPLIAGDIDSVKRGAVAAYAFDYKDHGKQAGKIAVQILQGTPISKIPVQYAENLQLAVNLPAAQAMGVTIPDDLKAKANQTF